MDHSTYNFTLNGTKKVHLNSKFLARTIISSVKEQNQIRWSVENENVNQYCHGSVLIEKILMDPYNYLQSKPGKGIRAKLIASFNYWLQVPTFALEIITAVVEMLHTSSLLYSAFLKSLMIGLMM